mgnify:FL=1
MELKILKQEETPENVIEHSKAVYKKAMVIAANFKNADKDLIKKGALLHDIGRSKTHGISHAVEGAKIVKQYGYPEEVQNIVERHIGAGITEEESVKLGLPKKSYIPQTIEEKIVAHADNLLSGTKDVDIDFDIAKWKRKIDKPEENIKLLIELDNELIKAFEDD